MHDDPPMQVNKYDLYLDVDYRKLSYKGGSVTIYMSNEDVTNINAVDLTILRVKVDGRDGEHSYDGKAISIKNPPVRERVEIEFEGGKVPDLLMGIYRAPYEGGLHDNDSIRGDGGARRMFPCIDHPAYKAIFKVTIKIDKDLDAIFNMPPARVMEEGGKKS